MKNEIERKEILKKIIGEFQYSDDNTIIIVWDRLVEKYSNGDKELENKTYNLLKMINEAKNTSDEEFKKFMQRDIESDIWYVI